MSDYNHVAQIGRLTRDPELSYTPGNNTALCRFSIAGNRKWKSNGEQKEHVNYFDVSVWGKMAEVCNQYLSKGSQVHVSGELKQERFQDKQGQNKSKVIINADKVQFIGSNNNQDGKSSAGYAPQQDNISGGNTGYGSDYSNYEDSEDSIPF